MAATGNTLDEQIITELKALLWGSDLKDEVFSRWTQGFEFSEHERTALIQHEGGPCAVIAPIQGFIIKNYLFCENPKEDLSQVTEEEAQEYLALAFGDVFLHTCSGNYCILSLDGPVTDKANNQGESDKGGNPDTGESSCKKSRLDQESFHAQLRCTKCEDEETMRKCIKTNMCHFQQSSGVLLYMYSIILTKGIEQIKNEVEDPGQPLIDGTYGHGSQSLINLLITGNAVSNVWDNDQDVSGLKLHGVPRRATIGFLTFMEHLRYCEVGWHLKNPVYPIWLIGSETHLTVIFSKETKLVINESLEANARHCFQRFDPEGNGFISTPLLGDLLSSLDLVSVKEYVDIMQSKLDEESLGIITMCSFMEEFYPGETTQEVPKMFKVYHYNGIPRSCQNNKVQYAEGAACLQDEVEVQILTDVSPIKMCLLTKWPTIEIKWANQHIPSLN